jgi:hypothetical protein
MNWCFSFNQTTLSESSNGKTCFCFYIMDTYYTVIVWGFTKDLRKEIRLVLKSYQPEVSHHRLSFNVYMCHMNHVYSVKSILFGSFVRLLWQGTTILGLLLLSLLSSVVSVIEIEISVCRETQANSLSNPSSIFVGWQMLHCRPCPFFTWTFFSD